MTQVESLLQQNQSVPFDILRVAHVELLVTDLAASEYFYGDLLGMIVTERTDDAVYLRGWEEFLHHSLVLRKGPVAAIEHIAFRVRGEDDLPKLEQEFQERGCPTTWTDGHVGHGRSLRVQDPLGFPLEFFSEMEIVESNTQEFHLHRGGPIQRFDHVNFHVNNSEEALVFWQELGFRVIEYISTEGEDERITGAWMRRKPTVHDVALTNGGGPRLHHFAMWLADPTAVLRVCDQLAAAGYVHTIERGPGRHGVSNAFFVYLRDPDGHRIELYTCDYYTGDPDHPAKRWSTHDPRCRSFWGTKTPDSWYEESSLVLDADGKPTDYVESDIDERSEVSS
jgi:catechol 2,3-dioxygenase